MAGRSAFARVKFNEQAKDDTKKQGVETSLKVYAGPHFSSTGPRRPESVIFSGRAGSIYGYRSSPIQRPQPLVLTSAIEKSEARVHVEGISTILRNTIGKMIKVGEDGSISNRNRPLLMAAGLSLQTPHIDTIPSVDCVPALSPSVSPETEHFPGGVEDSSAEFEKYKDSFRRFQGGGKLPELDWTSLSHVSTNATTPVMSQIMLNLRQHPELWDEEGDTFVYLFSKGNKSKVPPAFRINSQVIVDSGSVEFIDKLQHMVEPEGWPRFSPFDNLSASGPESDPLGRPSSPLTGTCKATSPFRLTFCPSNDVTKAPPGIRYELYVPWPGLKESGIQEVLWHVTTRNFLAILYNSSAIIGTTWYEAFAAVLKRIQVHPGYLPVGQSHVDWIVQYIRRHKFDDVRNNPSYAASLLAFSELPDVQWRDGYIEAFAHSVGMYHLGQIDDVFEWRYITPHTQIYISNASMEIDDRIHQAQLWLASFDLTEMWPATSAPPTSARGCFDRLRRWFCGYYEKAFGRWPPNTGEEQTWLNHQTVQVLKNDFHTLYDYLVNRDVKFESHFDRSGRRWRIVNKSDQSVRPDSSDMPLTDILVAFDERNQFPHIPHPYPHTPDPILARSRTKITFRKTSSPAKLQADARRKARAYAEASNVYALRDRSMNWDLLMSFIRFEQSDMLDTTDPFEARRGRWILIYGILQVLATISVDSPHLRYKDGSLYYLNPQMKGVVPWADPESPPEEQAEHEGSHCWTVPSTWPCAQPQGRTSPTYQPIIWNGFGDGRDRCEDLTSMAGGGRSGSVSPMTRDSVAEVRSLEQILMQNTDDPLGIKQRRSSFMHKPPAIQLPHTR